MTLKQTHEIQKPGSKEAGNRWPETVESPLNASPCNSPYLRYLSHASSLRTLPFVPTRTSGEEGCPFLTDGTRAPQDVEAKSWRVSRVCCHKHELLIFTVKTSPGVESVLKSRTTPPETCCSCSEAGRGTHHCLLVYLYLVFTATFPSAVC